MQVLGLIYQIVNTQMTCITTDVYKALQIVTKGWLYRENVIYIQAPSYLYYNRLHSAKSVNI